MAGNLCSFDTPDIKEVEEPISERLKKKISSILIKLLQAFGKTFPVGDQTSIKNQSGWERHQYKCHLKAIQDFIHVYIASPILEGGFEPTRTC